MAEVLDIAKLIYYKPKFLDKDTCELLINYFEQGKNRSVKERCPEAVYNIETQSTFDRIDVPYGTGEYKLISAAIEKIINLYHDYTDQFKMFHAMRRETMLYSHMIRLLKYETGAKIHPHTDHDAYVYGSCTFNLNEDYEGGVFNFFRGHIRYKLEMGDALIFPADFHWVHEVEPITKGVRYSTNCFLQSIPESVKEEARQFMVKKLQEYKFNPKDGVKYNIKQETLKNRFKI